MMYLEVVFLIDNLHVMHSFSRNSICQQFWHSQVVDIGCLSSAGWAIVLSSQSLARILMFLYF